MYGYIDHMLNSLRRLITKAYESLLRIKISDEYKEKQKAAYLKSVYTNKYYKQPINPQKYKKMRVFIIRRDRK